MFNSTCKICFDNKKEILIRPCNCNSVVHESCLKKWIEIKSDPEFCEICKTKYNVTFSIIRIQEQTIILDDNYGRNYILNNKIPIAILILISTLFVIFIYVAFGGQLNNISVPHSSLKTP